MNYKTLLFNAKLTNLQKFFSLDKKGSEVPSVGMEMENAMCGVIDVIEQWNGNLLLLLKAKRNRSKIKLASYSLCHAVYFIRNIKEPAEVQQFALPVLKLLNQRVHKNGQETAHQRKMNTCFW